MALLSLFEFAFEKMAATLFSKEFRQLDDQARRVVLLLAAFESRDRCIQVATGTLERRGVVERDALVRRPARV